MTLNQRLIFNFSQYCRIHFHYFLPYIYIYIYVCVCVCACVRVDIFLIIFKSTYYKHSITHLLVLINVSLLLSISSSV